MPARSLSRSARSDGLRPSLSGTTAETGEIDVTADDRSRRIVLPNPGCFSERPMDWFAPALAVSAGGLPFWTEPATAGEDVQTVFGEVLGVTTNAPVPDGIGRPEGPFPSREGS